MNDMFHKKLRDTFREKFETYSEPYKAENWAKLEKRLLYYRKKRVIKYTLAMAASLGLIFLIIVLYNMYPEDYTIIRIREDTAKDIIGSTKVPMSVTGSATVGNQDNRNAVMADLSLSKDNVFILEPDEVEKRGEGIRDILLEYKEKDVIEPLLIRRPGKGKPVKFETENSLLAVSSYIRSVSEEKEKEIKLGIIFSPLINQAENDYNTKICFAGGVSSEIPLFSQLKVDVGVLLSKQVIGIDSKIEGSQKTEVYGSSPSKKMDVQLLALDIPINLKYDLMENSRGSLFVSAGISSVVYFEENYKSAYYAETFLAIDENPERAVTVYKEEEKSVKAFNRIDAAKIINFSMGVNYRLRNGMDIQIEPFIKYPVSPLTSENIKLGSGGIQFRVYF
ncbi:MAG: outer membrane beta-barrel protein [bacterium]